MNPSTKGWLNKYKRTVAINFNGSETFDVLYNAIRNTGFIYGMHTAPNIQGLVKAKYSSDEIAKLQLIDALYRIFLINRPKENFDDFISELCSLYNNIYVNAPVEATDNSYKLEKYIHRRVSLAESILIKNFQKSIANRLLFIDVLAFQRHLDKHNNVSVFASEMEFYILNISYEVTRGSMIAGNIKTSKKYNEAFKTSFRIANLEILEKNNDFRQTILHDLSDLEKRYLLDIGCFICYSDLSFSESDLKYLSEFSRDIGINESIYQDSIAYVEEFFSINKEATKFLDKSNSIANFYNHNTVFVTKLIERNKRRITKEIGKSQELINLIYRSQNRKLTIEEHKRSQKLLKDIVKSVPSLTIFMLPGGAILLPLFAKLLPDLMPSSFDDNSD